MSANPFSRTVNPIRQFSNPKWYVGQVEKVYPHIPFDTTSSLDTYGSIQFRLDRQISDATTNIARPFDRNNISLPIPGEDILLLSFETLAGSNGYFYIPLSNNNSTNYRSSAEIKEFLKKKESIAKSSSSQSQKTTFYRNTQNLGVETASPPIGQTNEEDIVKLSDEKTKYNPDSSIKFLTPYEGDTIIVGRKGSSIRLSQFWGVDNLTNPSVSTIIRNGQNNSETSDETILENINNDGSSLHFLGVDVDNKFQQTTSTEDRRSTKWVEDITTKPNRTFLVSDRLIFSSKNEEFITFSKKNIGFRTDAEFSVDAKSKIYLYTESGITLESKGKNEIFLNSGENGKVYVGKRTNNVVNKDNEVQKMVLGNQLVAIIEKLILAILRLNFNTPLGQSTNADTPSHFPRITGNGGSSFFKGGEHQETKNFGTPNNTQEFLSILSELQNILSDTNFVSK